VSSDETGPADARYRDIWQGIRPNGWLLAAGIWSGLAGVVLIGAVGIAAWAGLFRGDPFREPACLASNRMAPASGCVAMLPITDIAVGFQAQVGLSPNGGLLVLGGEPRNDKTRTVMAGFTVADGREAWRVPLDGCGGPHVHVSLDSAGDKAAIWGCRAEYAVRVLAVPGGASIANIPLELSTGLITPYYDVAFADGDSAIVTGLSGNRRILPLANPASEPAMPPGFAPNAACPGVNFVGQSNTGYVQSRDGRAVIFLRAASTPPPIRTGAFTLSRDLMHMICGAHSVAMLSPPEDWPDTEALFASFSPTDDRLAVVYDKLVSKGEFRTLIEIWDTSKRGTEFSDPLERLAAFPMRGVVGYRIGWSPDGRLLAAVRATTRKDMDARIYAVP